VRAMQLRPKGPLWAIRVDIAASAVSSAIDKTRHYRPSAACLSSGLTGRRPRPTTPRLIRTAGQKRLAAAYVKMRTGQVASPQHRDLPHAPYWLWRAVVPEALDAGRLGVVPARGRRRLWARICWGISGFDEADRRTN
jgi:hypothetical protein